MTKGIFVCANCGDGFALTQETVSVEAYTTPPRKPKKSEPAKGYANLTEEPIVVWIYIKCPYCGYEEEVPYGQD